MYDSMLTLTDRKRETQGSSTCAIHDFDIGQSPVDTWITWLTQGSHSNRNNAIPLCPAICQAGLLPVKVICNITRDEQRT